jgi:hypothetical protein
MGGHISGEIDLRIPTLQREWCSLASRVEPV